MRSTSQRAAASREFAKMKRFTKASQFRTINLPAVQVASRTPEVKFVDTPSMTSNFATDSAPPVAQPILTLVQGAAAYNRIGQKITLKNLRVRGNIRNLATAVQGTARVIIVYDRQANGALPLWTDVIGAVSSAGAASSTVRDGLQLANRERFVILADEQIWLPSVTNTAGVLTNVGSLNATDKNPSAWNFDRFIKLKDMETHFNNVNGGTIADIQTGSLSLFVVQDSGSNANSWQFDWAARIRFMDY